MTTTYTVSVLVNDETKDPKVASYESRSEAERTAETYVDNAQSNGWYLSQFAPSSWKLIDEDGDRIHVLIENETDADPFAGIVDVPTNDGWDA